MRIWNECKALTLLMVFMFLLLESGRLMKKKIWASEVFGDECCKRDSQLSGVLTAAVASG